MPAKAVVLLPQAAATRVEQMNALARDVVFERVDPGADPAEIHAACAGAVVLVAPNRPTTNDIAAGIDGLKLVQTFSAGTEGLDKARLLNLGIQVANCGGGNAACVAEHAIGLLLMVNHKLDRQAASVRAGGWSRDVTGPLSDFQTLTDKRIGIVGLGNIGSGVARRLKTWGAEIVYHDVVQYHADYELRAGARRIGRDEIFATSDIVSLHVPLDASTRAMVSTAEFRAMKPTAVLINTCRGPVVDEAALIHALQTGEIFAAGLDVMETEPIAADNPLVTMPNVVLTPHLGSRAVESTVSVTRNAVENAERIARGEPPEWVVEPV